MRKTTFPLQSFLLSGNCLPRWSQTSVKKIYARAFTRCCSSAFKSGLFLSAHPTAAVPPTFSRFCCSASGTFDKSVLPMYFEHLSISEATRRAVKNVLSLEKLSLVQKKVLPLLLNSDTDSPNSDFLVQAKTGTGKTLTFLLPIIEQIASKKITHLSALILAPTRELALQITKEAEQLTAFHSNIRIIPIVGGANSRRNDEIAIRRKQPNVMVGTVGRIMDHFESTFMFDSLFKQLDTLVLDEADRLLGIGSLDELKSLLSCLPKKKRSLLFSATLNDEVREITAKACKANYIYVDCIGTNNAPTHEKVDQSVIVYSGIKTATVLYNVLMNEMRDNLYEYKIIVFFPTARATAFFSGLFREQFKIGVYELHRRREANIRQITSNRFIKDNCGILFTSDISARGMDYPNVSLVVQVGVPSSRELYIHRVGRTARVDKQGKAVLLVNEYEQNFLKKIKDIPFHLKDICNNKNNDLLDENEMLINGLSSWLSSTYLQHGAAACYASLLTHFYAMSSLLKLSSDDIICASQNIMLSTGLVQQPAVSHKLSVMLEMENHPKLRIQQNLDSANYLHDTTTVKY